EPALLPPHATRHRRRAPRGRTAAPTTCPSGRRGPGATRRPTGAARMSAGPGTRRRVVDGLADACGRLGAHRWPPDLADTMADEWRAELAALRADTSLPERVRLWRALAFAIGLVRFRSVGSEQSTWDALRSRGARVGP